MNLVLITNSPLLILSLQNHLSTRSHFLFRPFASSSRGTFQSSEINIPSSCFCFFGQTNGTSSSNGSAIPSLSCLINPFISCISFCFTSSSLLQVLQISVLPTFPRTLIIALSYHSLCPFSFFFSYHPPFFGSVPEILVSTIPKLP